MSYAVSWDDHQKSIFNGLGALQQKGEFVDMTLAAEGHHVKVHQMIMSLVSPYIKELITSANCPHPIIFLNKVSYQTLQSILEYVYTGEAVVRKDRIGEFIQASKDLHIKGLEDTLQFAQTTLSEMYTHVEDRNNEIDEKIKNVDTDNIKKLDYETNDEMEHAEFTEEVFDHTDDDDCLLEVKTTPQSTVKKETAPVGKVPSFQYSISSHGKIQIVLNRYIFSLRHTRKDNQKYWRCISQQNTKCPAYVTTIDDKITKRARVHNHAYHDGQILKRVKNGNMFSALNELERAFAAKKRKLAEDQAAKTSKGISKAWQE